MTDDEIKLIHLETTGFDLDVSDADLLGFARRVEQASRRAALKEAAAVVSDHERKGREWIAGSLWDTLANECAARIRALVTGGTNG